MVANVKKEHCFQRLGQRIGPRIQMTTPGAHSFSFRTSICQRPSARPRPRPQDVCAVLQTNVFARASVRELVREVKCQCRARVFCRASIYRRPSAKTTTSARGRLRGWPRPRLEVGSPFCRLHGKQVHISSAINPKHLLSHQHPPPSYQSLGRVIGSTIFSPAIAIATSVGGMEHCLGPSQLFQFLRQFLDRVSFSFLNGVRASALGRCGPRSWARL